MGHPLGPGLAIRHHSRLPIRSGKHLAAAQPRARRLSDLRDQQQPGLRQAGVGLPHRGANVFTLFSCATDLYYLANNINRAMLN